MSNRTRINRTVLTRNTGFTDGLEFSPIMTIPAQVAARGWLVSDRDRTNPRCTVIPETNTTHIVPARPSRSIEHLEENREILARLELRDGPARQVVLTEPTQNHQPLAATIHGNSATEGPVPPKKDEEESSGYVPHITCTRVRETPRASTERTRGDPLPAPLQRSQNLPPPPEERRIIIGTSADRNGQTLRSFAEFQEAREKRQKEIRRLQRPPRLLARTPGQVENIRTAFERDDFLDLVQNARPELDNEADEEEKEEGPRPETTEVPRLRRRRGSADSAQVPIERRRPKTSTVGNNSSSERGRTRTRTHRSQSETQRATSAAEGYRRVLEVAVRRDEECLRQDETLRSIVTGVPRGLGAFLGSTREQIAYLNGIMGPSAF